MWRSKFHGFSGLVFVFILLIAVGGASPTAAAQVHKSIGQTIHLAIHTEVIYDAKGRTLPVTGTLYFRNIDPAHKLSITSKILYGPDGALLKTRIKDPISLGPLQSRRVILPSIKEGNLQAGASLIIKWESNEPINPPLVEGIFIAPGGQQGISFVTRGVVLEERQ